MEVNMGLFGKSSPVLCAVCGNEAVHKHKAADGIICDDCFLAAGFKPGMVCFGTEIEHIKHSINANKSGLVYTEERPLLARLIHGLGVNTLSFVKMYFEADKVVVVLNQQKYFIPVERVLAVDFIDNKNIATKNKNVVGRGIVGGLLFGPAGLILGGLSGIGTKTAVTIETAFVVSFVNKNGEIDNLVFEYASNLHKGAYQKFADAFNANFKKVEVETVDNPAIEL